MLTLQALTDHRGYARWLWFGYLVTTVLTGCGTPEESTGELAQGECGSERWVTLSDFEPGCYWATYHQDRGTIRVHAREERDTFDSEFEAGAGRPLPETPPDHRERLKDALRDWLDRNGYSPSDWDELTAKIDAGTFTLEDVPPGDENLDELLFNGGSDALLEAGMLDHAGEVGAECTPFERCLAAAAGGTGPASSPGLQIRFTTGTLLSVGPKKGGLLVGHTHPFGTSEGSAHVCVEAGRAWGKGDLFSAISTHLARERIVSRQGATTVVYPDLQSPVPIEGQIESVAGEPVAIRFELLPEQIHALADGNLPLD